MTAKIIKLLTMIKNKNKITNEQVLFLAKRVDAQRLQKALLARVQENSISDMIRCMRHKAYSQTDKQTSKRQGNANTMAQATNPCNDQPFEKHVPALEMLIISNR